MATNRRQRYVFQLSGFSGEEKADLAAKIHRLKGVYLQEQAYVPSCTHVVSSKPCRSEKYLAACAAGKWIVTRNFLDDSASSGRWLEESSYEFGRNTVADKANPLTLQQAPRRWRQKVARETVGAFAGWCSIVVVDDQKRRAAYKRLLLSGGATVLQAKPVAMNQTAYAPQLTHVFMDKKYNSNFRTLRRRGVLCLSPDYIAEFLLQNPPADPAKFDVAMYDASATSNPSAVSKQKTTVATEVKSQASNSRRTSPRDRGAEETPPTVEVSRVLRSVSPSQNRHSSNTRNTRSQGSISKPSPTKKRSPVIQLMQKVTLASPKKLRKGSFPTPEKVKKESIPTPREQREASCPTSEKLKKGSIPTPRELRKAPCPTPEKQRKGYIPTPRELLEHSGPTPRELRKGSCPTPEKVKKESIPTLGDMRKGSCPTTRELRKDSCPTPDKVSIPTSETLRKESIPTPEKLGKASFPIQGKAALPTPAGKVLSLSQQQLEGLKKRPLVTDSGKDRDTLQLVASKRRKLDVPGACFQPCFPVNNNKSRTTQVSQRGPLPLGPAVCTTVEVALDDHAYPAALGLLQSTLSAARFPPSHIIHRVMSEALLQAEDALAAAQAYQVLKQVQTLHPPSRTPVSSYLYLKALRAPVQEQVERGKGRKGRKPQPEKQKEGVEWDFVRMVISGAMTILPTTEETSTSPQHQSNCALLLKFLVSVLEQDFMAWVDRENHKSGSPPCLLATLLWPSGHCGVMTSHVTDLVTLLFQGLRAGKEQASTVRLVQSLVAMAAECCQATDRQCDRMTSLTGSFSIGTSVCNLAQHITATYQKDPANQTKAVLHLLLETLQPPWLKLKVAQSLLGCYDDSLVAREQQGFHKKPLSLRRVLLCYMYLVPKSLVSTQTGPATKDKVKVPQENPPTPAKAKVEQGRLGRRGSSRGEPLRTLVDANHVQRLPVVAGKRGRSESVSSTPEGLPKKKPKLQVNRRNVRGETQLHVACIKNNVPRVRELLSVPGVDVNAEDYAGWTPLHEACNHGHVEVVKELLAFKAPRSVSSFFTPKNKDTPVKPPSAVDLFASPPDGTTALHDAVSNGHVAVVTLLLQAGGKALLSKRNASGQTPSDLAFTEDMKAALQAFSVPRRKAQVSTNKNPIHTAATNDTKNPPKVPNTTANNQLVRDADYDRVFGQGRMRKTANSEDYEKFATVVSHFTRAYIRLEQLQPMKKQREKQLECGSNDSSHSSVCSYENGRFKGANTSPVSPVVVLEDIMQKVKSEEVKGVEEDLTSYMDMDQYLMGYERHLKMLMGKKEAVSDFCGKSLMEIRLCS